MASQHPSTNRTYQILSTAEDAGDYAVGAFNCYDALAVQAVIRAAERSRSPAIISLFPWAMHFHGPHFVTYAVAAAHAAAVPIAVHLDHCSLAADAARALALPTTFDSIMVDGEIEYVRDVVVRACARGVTVEAELGRVGGAEDGVPAADGVLTDPAAARAFVEQTGVHYLAPSFGNVHGCQYGPGGPEGSWQLSRVADIRRALLEATGTAGGGRAAVPLVLHGTSPAGDTLIRSAIAGGMRKVNVNRMVREGYMQFLINNVAVLPPTRLQEEGLEVYARDVERLMREVLGSAGRA